MEKSATTNDALYEAFSEKKNRGPAKEGDDKALLFIENEQKSVNSAITQEDFEVFMRVQTYKNRCLRTAKKTLTSIKWLPMTHRFSIWQESRVRMFELKSKQQADQLNKLNAIKVGLKKKLDDWNITDDKVIYDVYHKYTFHLNNVPTGHQTDKLLKSFVSDVLPPPIIMVSNSELKLNLQALANEYP